MHDLKVCHPERNDNGVEGSTHHRGASKQIGEKILRLALLAQDDSWGGAVDRIGLSVMDMFRATARVAPTRSSADFANSHWVSEKSQRDTARTCDARPYGIIDGIRKAIAVFIVRQGASRAVLPTLFSRRLIALFSGCDILDMR